MSFQKFPTSLKMDHLFLDARLDAIPLLGNNVVDLLGNRTFSVGMLRKNKGFGITNISVETKASMQPIVEITFKDLYGNTVFGTLTDSNNGEVKLDYSLLFDWPPPKFRFTFKGYLGRPVTWIMNLKKHVTTFNSSDGSFEIKVSFVPNQWGFLADIPFLYLLAKKRLKRDMNKNSAPNVTQSKIESIFDIIKIGKTVEVKTKQISKEFDKLKKQLSILKTLAIDGLINKDFEPNDTIDGRVAGRQPIQGVKGVSGQNELGNFSAITISLPTSLDATDAIKFQETLKGLKANGEGVLNEHRKIIAIIGNAGSTAANMATLGKLDGDIQSIQADINAGVKKIDDNLKLIDIETKRRLFETSSTELGAVTISEVFSRIAADGAFILGSILDAGYTGFQNNTPARTKKRTPSEKPLIGRYFPLTIDSSSGEQVPAFDVGIADMGAEMDFVRKFIVAISEGIADNQANNTQENFSIDSVEGKLSSRINNLEIINPNPYKDANAQHIEECLLVRSGIAAYITRSYDPNQPGDYNAGILKKGVDNDAAEEISSLAKKELKNITDDILNSLSAEDYSELKRFCRYIKNLLHPNGKSLMSSEVERTIPTDISQLKSFRSLVTQNGQVEDLGTIENEFKKFIKPNSIFYEGNPKGLTDSISFDNFKAGYLYHNNTLWAIPRLSSSTNKYTYVVFKNQNDISVIDTVMNNDSDSEFNNTDDKESDTPLGIVKLTNGNDNEDINPNEIERLHAINNRIEKQLVFDYSRLQNINILPTRFEGDVAYPALTALNGNKSAFYEDVITEKNIGNGITYLVYNHIDTEKEPHITWGLFDIQDNRGRNQRIFLRELCVAIENRMNTLEDEKNNIISQVLGKAQSVENSLYIQMHHIFHQWGVLGFGMDSATVSTNKTSDGNNRVSEQQIAPLGRIAETLEKSYGDIVEIGPDGKLIATRNVGDDANVPLAPGGTAVSMGFRYDFPMERINPPIDTPKTNVAHSIINIEPLYTPNANTTLLNIIQQICSKNNFMFVPIPGNLDYTNIDKIFEPSRGGNANVGNVFHVLFSPTPENRSRQNDGTPLSLAIPQKNNFDAFEIEFGSVDNTVIKNVQVSTTDDKPTAESILNLQRLVDKDNSNKAITTDCSILSVMEGRSYKMQVDIIGNAQVSPMQYFYVPKMPIFSGLYQIMNVKHAITVNNMVTTFEGIKMRFDGSQMKGVAPITLESLKALGNTSNISQPLVGSSSPNPTPPVPLVPEPMEQRTTNNNSNKNTPVSSNNNNNTKGIYLPGGKGPKTQDPTLDSLVNGYVNQSRYDKIVASLRKNPVSKSILDVQVPDFQMPINYTKVSSKFGLRSYVAHTGKNDPDNPDFHPGIDLVGPPNTEIRSVADGTVYLARRISSREETITLSTLAIPETETRITGTKTLGKKTDGTDYISNAASTGFIKYIKNLGPAFELKVTWITPDVGTGNGYGQVVIIKHNSRFYSLYAHLNEVKVTKGQEVKKGDPIGTQGNTMDGLIRSTSAHLHFEIWDRSVCSADFVCAVNPDQYLTF